MKYILLFIFGVLGCAVRGQQPNVLNEYNIQGFAQGTTYNIKYFSSSIISKESIDSILQAIDKSMSIYRVDSDISTFNNIDSRRIKMDVHMKSVIEESFKTYRKTKGQFDITIKPLVDIWGFGKNGIKQLPTEKEVKKAKSLVGMNFLRIKGDYLIKRKKKVSIDVNGIAQGYSVDVLANYFLSKGVENFIIELGGEIVTRGSKPNGDFVVQIQRPYQYNINNAHNIVLKNKAITSSGNYEKQSTVDGKTFSHHIDPLRGYPIDNQTVSVTVIANTAMEADAIDNYLMFLKPHEAINYAENQKDIEVYLVYSENNMFKELQSSGFNNYIYK